MSSADPMEVYSPAVAPTGTPKAPLSKLGSRTAYEQATQDAADVRSERRQAKPEDRKTDRAEPQDDQGEDSGPKGIKGAFQKHPVAMIVCFGLIVVGVIAGIASPCPSLREYGRRLHRRTAGAGQSAGDG